MPTMTIDTTWKRRSALWITGVIAVAAYWDPKALNGPFIYDDVASIVNNDVVLANVPWQEAFSRDFWGTPMTYPQSHKSYRPITSLTLRWNMMWSYINDTAGKDDHTYYFHVVNVLLHGITTGLVTEAAAIVLGGGMNNMGAPIIAGILFGIHPVHAEAVSNITSRGEILMAMFFLLAFLSYANHIPVNKTEASDSIPLATITTTGTTTPERTEKKVAASDKQSTKAKKSSSSTPKDSKQPKTKQTESQRMATNNIVFLYVLPCLFLALSLFSKEQGITALCTIVAFDFIRNHSSLKEFLGKVQQGDAYSWAFLLRSGVLAIQTVLLAGLRYYLNGESKPEFVHEQNPAGFAEDRFVRVFSVNWVYCLYLRDMMFPIYLAPDWSGVGIPLIESTMDYRVIIVGLLWLCASGCGYSLCVGPSPKASKLQKDIRQAILISFFAFLFLPFLLSSNLLVTTGLTKGDRVIYLPLFGYCLLQGLLYKVISGYRGLGESVAIIGMYTLFTIQLSFYGLKTHERNLSWAHEYTLWLRAVEVNPLSFHTRSNVGRLLAKNGEYVEAEVALRPIGDVRTNGGNPNDTFLYAVALSKLDRCEEASRLIDDATDFIFDEREEGGIRYDPKMSFHAQSSLMVARAFCTTDVIAKGALMQKALVIDPTNDFAKGQLVSYVQTLQQIYLQSKQSGMNAHPQSQAELAAMERQLMVLEQQIHQLNQDQGQPRQQDPQQQQQHHHHQQQQQQQQRGIPPQNEEQMMQDLQRMAHVAQVKHQQGMSQDQAQMEAMQEMAQMKHQQGMSQDQAQSQVMQMVQMQQQQQKQSGGMPIQNEDQTMQALQQMAHIAQMKQQQGMPQGLAQEEAMQEIVQMKQKQGMSQDQAQSEVMQMIMQIKEHQQQQQQGMPQNQQQKMQGMQQQNQHQQQHQPRTIPRQSNEIPQEKVPPRNNGQGKRKAAQNIGLPPTQERDSHQNLGMPPIVEFESGKYDDIFFGENSEKVQETHAQQQQQQRHTAYPPADAPKESVPQNTNFQILPGATDIPQNLGLPPTQENQGLQPNLGMPPIDDFESSEFDDMFTN